MKHLINNKHELKAVLMYESKKYGLRSSRNHLICFRENQLLYKCNYYLRKIEYYTNCNKTIRKNIYKYLYMRYQRKYLIFIPINVFDKGLKLIHIGQRLVNGNAHVGKDCVMHINTSIVAGGSNDFAPKIGDNVILCVGSIVLGNAVVGDNIVVGAGAVVNKNFSEGNMTIAGVPAKRISNNTKEDWSKKSNKK